MEQLDQLTSSITYVLVIIVIMLIALAGLAVLGFILMLWYRYKDREEYSINSVLLEVSVPRGNETKIDAAEQMFSSLHTLYSGGWKRHFKPQDHLSFEVVALKEDIRFYISCSSDLRDMVENKCMEHIQEQN